MGSNGKSVLDFVNYIYYVYIINGRN